MEEIEKFVSRDLTEPMTTAEFRKGISELWDKILERPDAMIGDCCPLTHNFAKGLYVRQITMPAGSLVISKIHKYSHAAFILKGDVSIFEEGGARRVKAPASFITKVGTQRLIYNHEETVWTTVHATEETDVKKIEEEIIAKDFDEIDNIIKDIIPYEVKEEI